MDNFVWRYRARVVACIDLILAAVSVGYVVYWTIEALILISHINHAIAWGTLIVFLLMDILVGIHFWAALKLLSATEVGVAADESLEKSRIWRNANVILLIVVAILVVILIGKTSGNAVIVILIISYILGSAIYLLFMFIVLKFIQELEMVATSGGSATRTNNLNFV